MESTIVPRIPLDIREVAEIEGIKEAVKEWHIITDYKYDKSLLEDALTGRI